MTAADKVLSMLTPALAGDGVFCLFPGATLVGAPLQVLGLRTLPDRSRGRGEAYAFCMNGQGDAGAQMIEIRATSRCSFSLPRQ